MEKRLGKISSVHFGYVGYQDMQFGLQLEFQSQGWGVSTSISDAWALDIKPGPWTEEDRDSGYAKTMRELNRIMREAKVYDVNRLKGIPVELTFEGNVLKDWRVLSEVL